MRKKELEGMTVAELRALAKGLGAKPGVSRKAEIIENILKVTKKRAAAPTKRPKVKKEAPSKPKAGLVAQPSAAHEPVLVRSGPGLDAPKELMPFVKKRSAPEAAARPAAFTSRSFEKKAPATSPVKARQPLSRAAAIPQISVTIVPDTTADTNAEDVDWVAALALEPTRAFVSWELMEETIRRGTPILRVYDVTGRRFPLEDALSVFDACISARKGSAELGVSPGREYVVDVGVVGPDGRFMPARRSGRIFTPPGRPAPGEALLPEEHFRPPAGVPGSP